MALTWRPHVPWRPAYTWRGEGTGTAAAMRRSIPVTLARQSPVMIVHQQQPSVQIK